MNKFSEYWNECSFPIQIAHIVLLLGIITSSIFVPIMIVIWGIIFSVVSFISIVVHIITITS